mgnify:CR=1 FL=1
MVQEILVYIALTISIVSILIVLLMYSLIKRIRSQLDLIIKKDVEEALTKIKKIRRRYIVFSIVSEHDFDKRELEKAIRRKLALLYGMISLAKADPQLVFYDPKLKRGVLRTSHVMKDYVLAALSIIRNINEKQLLIIPIKTTGTIKKAKKIMYTIKTKT